MEENKVTKQNSKMGILVGVLITIIIVLGGYIVYKEFINKDTNSSSNSSSTKETNSNTEKDGNIDANDALVQGLLKTFKSNCWRDGENSISKNNLSRLRLAYENLSKDDIMERKCSEYSKIILDSGEYCGKGSTMTSEMSKYYAANDKEKFAEATKENITRVVDAKTLEAKYKELFSSKYEYRNESFGLLYAAELSCFIMNYDSSKNQYIEYGGQCGGTCGSETVTAKKAYKQGDYLYIEALREFESVEGISKEKETYKFKLENGKYLFDDLTEEIVK